MADNGKKSTDRAEAIILTDPEEMRKARFDQRLIDSEGFRRQMAEMNRPLGTSELAPKSNVSKVGRKKRALAS